jgi:hypothetical protein
MLAARAVDRASLMAWLAYSRRARLMRDFLLR